MPALQILKAGVLCFALVFGAAVRTGARHSLLCLSEELELQIQANPLDNFSDFR